jgi:hypothetical protein
MRFMPRCLTRLTLTQALPGAAGIPQPSLPPPNLYRTPVSFDSASEVPLPAPASVYVPSLPQVTVPSVFDASAAFEILKAQLEVPQMQLSGGVLCFIFVAPCDFKTGSNTRRGKVVIFVNAATAEAERR